MSAFALTREERRLHRVSKDEALWTAQERLLSMRDFCSKRRNTMNIHLAGSRPTRLAPKEYFTGTVWQDPIIAAEAPARIVSTRVSFEPGARTAWHSHPLGQTLYVISGVGRLQRQGGARREMRAAEFVWIPPGEKHWYGGPPANGMIHIARQESLDGNY